VKIKGPRTYGFGQLLVTYSVVLVISLLLLGAMLFTIVFNQLSMVQEQTSRYATVMQVASHLREHREAFNRLIFDSPSESQRIQILAELNGAETRAKAELLKLETSHEASPEQYFLLRGIRNGLDFISQQQRIMMEQLPLDVEGFTRYYVLETTYRHLDSYVYSRFLPSAVNQDAQAVSRMQTTIGNIRILSMVLVVFFAFIYTIAIILVVRSLSHPVQKMAETAREITKGNLETPDLPAVGPIEIRFLEQSLNSMKASLKERIETLDENAKLEKRIHQQELQRIKVKRELDRARLLTLQAQINPHFLFNAMNTISRTALFEDAEQTSELVTDLAGIFRYMLDQRTTVHLHEEIEFIRKYLKIQKIRFGDRLEYRINSSEEVPQLPIPPLIIQPLVENAIIHGLEPLEEGGMVEVNISQDKRKLSIIVRDTGVGIDDPDVMNTLESAPKGDNSHIGLTNVLERIKLYYGKSAKMEVGIAKPSGTIVTLLLPIRKQDRLGD